MAVTTQNVYSESREVLKNLLIYNIKDPKTGRTNSNRRWIYREFPDTTSGTFSGYPFIVLTSANINNNPITLNQGFRDNVFSFEIEVYVEFNDQNARVDDLSDSIIYVLLSSNGQTTMDNNKLVHPQIDTSPYDNVTIDGKKLSTRLISIDYSTELCF